MTLDFLPQNIIKLISELDYEKLSEIRLRKNREIVIFYKNEYIYLKDVLTDKNVSTIISAEDINNIIDTLTEHSIYAYNEQIKQGFLNAHNGIRIGLCGEVVFDGNKIKTITNFSSLNIRIPHYVKDASFLLDKYIFCGQSIKNTLILSPPFMGKTTILKDLALKINDKLKKQILIIDERGEFDEICGDFIDKISFSNKEYALNNCIRSISPQVIIADEIVLDDLKVINRIKRTGVKVIASCHAEDIKEINFLDDFNKDVFDLYIVLENNRKKGTVKNIYNSQFEVLV